MNGAERIAAERQRQIDDKGYSPDHDAHHRNGALAWAAAVYAAPAPIFHIEVHEGASDGVRQGQMAWHEPWPVGWERDSYLLMSPTQRVRQLEKAGALVAAEIDRLLASEES